MSAKLIHVNVIIYNIFHSKTLAHKFTVWVISDVNALVFFFGKIDGSIFMLPLSHGRDKQLVSLPLLG